MHKCCILWCVQLAAACEAAVMLCCHQWRFLGSCSWLSQMLAPLCTAAAMSVGQWQVDLPGVISYVACILITYLGFAMMRFGNIEQKYMRKLDGAAHLVSP